MSKKFKPTSDRVLVKLEELPEETAGGIYIPPSARTNTGCRYGKVVALGPGRYIDGTLCPIQGLSVGDFVACDTVGGLKVKVDGEEHVVFRYEELLGSFE